MEPRAPARVAVISLLKDGNFRTFLSVGGLVWTSWGLELLVLNWFILQETDSPFKVALVLFFWILPWPLFNLFTGTLADRFSRHRLLLVAQGINVVVATALLALFARDIIEPWHIFVAAFLGGISKSLEFPSRRPAIFDIVGERHLVSAMSLEVMLNTSGRMVGPILGGVLLSQVDFTGAFAFAVALHLLSLGLLMLVRIPSPRIPASGEAVLGRLATTFRYFLRSPTLQAILYLTIIMNGLGFPVQQFVPVIGRDNLDVGPALVGVLVSALGFGQLIGAAVMAMNRAPVYHGRVFVVGSLTFMVMAVFFAWSPWYALAFAIMTIGGIGTAGFDTMQSSITMLSSPREIRGGMVGLMTTGIGAGLAVGLVGTGAVASALDTQLAITIIASAGVVLFLPPLVLTPILRQQFGETQADATSRLPDKDPS